jgi:hypothetical protein
MNNSPSLDKPLVPLAVALRSMLAETEAKIAAAEPAEKRDLQRRAEVLREWLTPRSTLPGLDLATYRAWLAGTSRLPVGSAYGPAKWARGSEARGTEGSGTPLSY